jgi:CheY-like chemotaxis protein
VDLAAIVERVVRLRGYQLAAQSVRTEVRLDEGAPPVLGDTRQLQQVVLNLVTNALQAMPDGGVLRVATRARDRWADDGTVHEVVELDVADTGAGIPPDARSHIFEPFFTTKAEGQGTGLGLSVSYGIVAAHGGTLALADTSVAGTRFVVALPAASGAAPAGLAPEDGVAAASPLAGLRLLFVDDEPALRQSMEAFGRLRGFDVVTAPEGRAALAAVEAGGFDAVVCDLRMPGMDGAAFYEALRAHHPVLAQRTVMVTGDMMSGPARFSAGAGPVTLGKPFGFDQLEETVEALVRGAAPATGR